MFYLGVGGGGISPGFWLPGREEFRVEVKIHMLQEGKVLKYVFKQKSQISVLLHNYFNITLAGVVRPKKAYIIAMLEPF